MVYRGRVITIIDGLVKRGYLKRGAHPHYLTRTDEGKAALESFIYYGGVPADESRMRE
jgi:DNA-binding MarR family transcriptional regulator